MLTGDLDRLLAAEISALPPPANTTAGTCTTAGTWQPASPDSGAAAGTYGTPVAFRLASDHPGGPPRIAMTLAAALRRADWVNSATVTGGLMKGDRAQIDVAGSNHDGRKIKGVVALKKVGSNWRVVDQQFYGTE